MTRVLLADDHELMRNGVRALLESYPDIEVCGEASNGVETIEKTAALAPDVTILDLMMPGISALDVIIGIRARAPATGILVFSIDDSEVLIREVLAAGALGYVLKTDVGSHLVDAIKAVANHQTYFSSDVSNMFVRSFLKATPEEVEEPSPTPLSAREIEILKLLADGQSNKEIASALFISVRTVETHRRKIFLKLNITSMAELVRYAIRHHLSTA